MAKANKPPPLIDAFSVGFALILVWAVLIAGRNGLSDLHARPAIDYLEDKSVDDFIVSELEWQAIEASVTRAAKMIPGNPRYLETLGWLYQFRMTMFAENLSGTEIDASTDAIYSYFRQAIENRPTWPYRGLSVYAGRCLAGVLCDGQCEDNTGFSAGAQDD